MKSRHIKEINGRLIETDTAGATLAEYVYLNDMPLATVRPTDTVYYFHADHINTPRVMTNSAGTVAWRAAYHAFGYAEVDGSSTITNNIRFPGQYFDAETNFHYNWNRYYDPRTGRYLTPDPIGLKGGIDPFVYVENDPVNWIDPDGLEVMVCWRPVSGGPLRAAGGKHVYLHNTVTRENLGTAGSSGRGGPVMETPEKDKCATIKNSKGREKEVMEEMRRTRNDGLYVPGVWDCHYRARKAVESQGLKYPADAVGGRLYNRNVISDFPVPVAPIF